MSRPVTFFILALTAIANADVPNTSNVSDGADALPELPSDKKTHTAFEVDEQKALAFIERLRKDCTYKPSIFQMPEAASPDVVMGLATGYSHLQMAGFIVSLRNNGFDGNILLGVDGMHGKGSKKKTDMFAKYNVTAIDIGGMQLKIMAQVCRYVAYLDWVEHHVAPGARVMVSDIRDVVFQSHPFEDSPLLQGDTELMLFQESSRVNLYTQKLNRRWIMDAYGRDPVGGLKNYPVLCSGTTMGLQQGMVHYLQRMVAEIALCMHRHPSPVKKGKAKVNVCIGGTDQGFHNVLAHRRQLLHARLMPNGDPVLTVGIFAKVGETVSQNDKGFMINQDGKVAPVVHQYDKYSHLLRFVHSEYLKDFCGEEEFIHAMVGGARFSTKGG
ncbi:hypothetical protein CYMTET_16467 [Cymbomonas tetramitiformis]|uniref:Uncharacterized protein n=1 Tax=Cymbomonas tetramitiformis TaxID=36881 RepID=A0AAE0L7Z7_9CHLO|nr:hypothetical protein CYMTET_16467 [Cymbomonas tetramitiformis]